MAKASINSGGAVEPVHTRTTSDSTESQAAVLAIDGSDSVVPADATIGLRVNEAGSSTPSVASVTAAAADTVLDASNANRRGLIIYNASTSQLYMKYGSGASPTSYTIMIGPEQYWEMGTTLYTGAVNGYWAIAQGAALVTELTA